MRWAVVILLLVGCAPTSQERLHELTTDGVHLYGKGSYAGAREMFLAALTVHPRDPDLLYNVASCHEKMGEPDKAEKYYQQCLQYAPDHPQARHAMVARLVQVGKRDEAVRYVSNWLRSSPKQASPYLEDGWLYAQEGDIDSAKERFQQALALEPRNARALVELAQINEKLYRPGRALVLYERSLEVNPDQPVVRQRLKKLQAQGVSRPHPD